MTRYGKKLLEEGGHFYSRMNINEAADGTSNTGKR